MIDVFNRFLILLGELLVSGEVIDFDGLIIELLGE